MLRETANIKADIKYIFENIFTLYDSHTTLSATCALLGYYTAYGGNFLPDFHENLLVKMEVTGCPRMSVMNYH
jgi:hypothetical protein